MTVENKLKSYEVKLKGDFFNADSTIVEYNPVTSKMIIHYPDGGTFDMNRVHDEQLDLLGTRRDDPNYYEFFGAALINLAFAFQYGDLFKEGDLYALKHGIKKERWYHMNPERVMNMQPGYVPLNDVDLDEFKPDEQGNVHLHIEDMDIYQLDDYFQRRKLLECLFQCIRIKIHQQKKWIDSDLRLTYNGFVIDGLPSSSFKLKYHKTYLTIDGAFDDDCMPILKFYLKIEKDPVPDRIYKAITVYSTEIDDAVVALYETLDYFHLLEYNDDVDSLMAASTQPELEDHTAETDGSLYDDSEHNNK